jgi:hypothetical protein
MFAKLCVASAPTPAFAHGTTEPTAKYFDATATPHSFRSGSCATMENVQTQGDAGRAGVRPTRAVKPTIKRTSAKIAGRPGIIANSPLSDAPKP